MNHKLVVSFDFLKLVFNFFLQVFRKKRPEKSGVKGAATPSPGEAVSGKTDKTTIYRTKPE